MVYAQNFELAVPVRAVPTSNILNVDYCCVSYFGVCEKELIPNVVSYKSSTLIEK